VHQQSVGTTFESFPSATVEALAMFLERRVRRVREHRAQLLKEEKQIRKEVRG
jgi:hypothetical protein